MAMVWFLFFHYNENIELQMEEKVLNFLSDKGRKLLSKIFTFRCQKVFAKENKN